MASKSTDILQNGCVYSAPVFAASVEAAAERLQNMTSQPPQITTLKKRRDFLAAAGALSAARPGFIVQGRKRRAEEPSASAVRVGYTCSKRVGNAVARNRAKRRLRALAQALMPLYGREGWDYVLIGRAEETAARDFAQMGRDLEEALARLHDPNAKPYRPSKRGARSKEGE